MGEISNNKNIGRLLICTSNGFDRRNTDGVKPVGIIGTARTAMPWLWASCVTSASFLLSTKQ